MQVGSKTVASRFQISRGWHLTGVGRDHNLELHPSSKSVPNRFQILPGYLSSVKRNQDPPKPLKFQIGGKAVPNQQGLTPDWRRSRPQPSNNHPSSKSVPNRFQILPGD